MPLSRWDYSYTMSLVDGAQLVHSDRSSVRNHLLNLVLQLSLLFPILKAVPHYVATLHSQSEQPPTPEHQVDQVSNEKDVQHPLGASFVVLFGEVGEVELHRCQNLEHKHNDHGCNPPNLQISGKEGSVGPSRGEVEDQGDDADDEVGNPDSHKERFGVRDRRPADRKEHVAPCEIPWTVGVPLYPEDLEDHHCQQLQQQSQGSEHSPLLQDNDLDALPLPSGHRADRVPNSRDDQEDLNRQADEELHAGELVLEVDVADAKDAEEEHHEGGYIADVVVDGGWLGAEHHRGVGGPVDGYQEQGVVQASQHAVEAFGLPFVDQGVHCVCITVKQW